MQEKLNWNNLKNNKCPKCGRSLMWKLFTYGSGYICKEPQCDFLINENKFKELIY